METVQDSVDDLYGKEYEDYMKDWEKKFAEEHGYFDPNTGKPIKKEEFDKAHEYLDTNYGEGSDYVNNMKKKWKEEKAKRDQESVKKASMTLDNMQAYIYNAKLGNNFFADRFDEF